MQRTDLGKGEEDKPRPTSHQGNGGQLTRTIFEQQRERELSEECNAGYSTDINHNQKKAYQPTNLRKQMYRTHQASIDKQIHSAEELPLVEQAKLQDGLMQRTRKEELRLGGTPRESVEKGNIFLTKPDIKNVKDLKAHRDLYEEKCQRRSQIILRIHTLAKRSLDDKYQEYLDKAIKEYNSDIETYKKETIILDKTLEFIDHNVQQSIQQFSDTSPDGINYQKQKMKEEREKQRDYIDKHYTTVLDRIERHRSELEKLQKLARDTRGSSTHTESSKRLLSQ